MFINYDKNDADAVIREMRVSGRPENIMYKWLWFDRVFFDYIRDVDDDLIKIYNDAASNDAHGEILTATKLVREAIHEKFAAFFSLLDLMCSDKLRTDIFVWHCPDPLDYEMNCIKRWLFDSDYPVEVIRRNIWGEFTKKMDEICRHYYGCAWGKQKLDRQMLTKFCEYEIPVTEPLLLSAGFRKVTEDSGESCYEHFRHDDEHGGILRITVTDDILTIYCQNGDIKFRVPLDGTVRDLAMSLGKCDFENVKSDIMNFID